MDVRPINELQDGPMGEDPRCKGRQQEEGTWGKDTGGAIKEVTGEE